MSARERVIIVSVVHGMCKILCQVTQQYLSSFELLGPKQLLPHNLYVCAHHLV
jgi:hypothetical protein